MQHSIWQMSHRCDAQVRPMADRHYNRQSIGAKNFAPPGRCIVLKIPNKAFWITAYPYAEYVRHEWAGAFVCCAFRNESNGEYLSSDLVREACAVTRWHYPNIPELGMVTFIDPKHVRKKRDFGRCYRKAGFKHVGYTKVHKLIALQLLPKDFPKPLMPYSPYIHSFRQSVLGAGQGETQVL